MERYSEAQLRRKLDDLQAAIEKAFVKLEHKESDKIRDKLELLEAREDVLLAELRRRGLWMKRGW